MNFKDLGLHAALTDKCEQMGYTEPTPIQKQAIPIVFEGRDLIACAETGTGKTAAFLLPTLQKLATGKRPVGTKVLVLAPTRELANQTDAACRKFAAKGITCTSIIGGTGYRAQENALKRNPTIIIATPGRLMDFMEQGRVNLAGLTTLVLDEADRMLDMGFLPDIKRVLKYVPTKRQTLFFSATMPPPIMALTRELLHNAVTINLERKSAPATGITQAVYPVAHDLKSSLLLALLERDIMREALVFTRTKHRANRREACGTRAVGAIA